MDVMKKILIINLLFFVALCFCQVINVTYAITPPDTETYATPRQQPLVLEVQSDKQLYRVGDTITFILNFENKTLEDRNIYIENIYWGTHFKVTDETGTAQPSEYSVIYDLVWSEDLYHLVKAKEVYRHTIVANIVGDSEGNLMIDFNDSFIKLNQLGKFDVFVSYEGWDGTTTDKDGKAVPISEKFGFENVFLGKLKSNTITIEIVK